jgi:hypothetical protein
LRFSSKPDSAMLLPLLLPLLDLLLKILQTI